MGKESIASPTTHQSSYKQPPRNFYLTAAWLGPSLCIPPPKSTPLSSPRKPPDRKQGSLEAPSRLSVPLQPPTFPWLALCLHGLLLVTKTEHKPHSTRARPGLPFARHKHLMSISGVSNPSCSVGGVRSFLSTLTPSLPGRGLGEMNLFFVYSSLLDPNCPHRILTGSHGDQAVLFPFYQSHTPSCPLKPQPRGDTPELST